MSLFSDVISSRSDLDWCWYLRKHGAKGERLERILHDIGVLQPGSWARWQNSSLTNTGAPTEIIFGPHCDVMSLRTEVADPASDTRIRAAQVCDAIAALGLALPPGSLRDVISAAQGDSPLAYGAWLGLTVSRFGLSATLFAEVPDQAADLTDLLTTAPVAACLRDMDAGVRIRSLAFDCATGETTVHCRSVAKITDILCDLAMVADVPQRPLMTGVELLLKGVRQSETLQSLHGFSLTMPHAGGAPRLTFDFSAREAFGSDAATARFVRAHPGDHLAAYAAFDDILLPAADGDMNHGTISLLARNVGAPALSVSMAAPWDCPHFLLK